MIMIMPYPSDGFCKCARHCAEPETSREFSVFAGQIPVAISAADRFYGQVAYLRRWVSPGIRPGDERHAFDREKLRLGTGLLYILYQFIYTGLQFF